MVEDARLEDGGEKSLRLHAHDGADLEVISSLLQDAVFSMGDLKWHASKREFAILINRFRWEAQVKRPERVRAVLQIQDVMAVRSQGIDRQDTEVVLSLLALQWQPGEDGMGTLAFILAGDGEIALQVEAVNVTLQDVTRPYTAPSRQRPSHPDA